MNPWIEPWKPFFPLVNMSQFIPLVSTIPLVWQIVFTVVLLTLLAIYYLFLVIRAYPWRKPPAPPKKPALEPPVELSTKPRRPKPRRRRR